MLKQFKKL